MSKTDELLIRALHEARIFVTDEQRALLARHLDLVIERNRNVNLTRITSLEEATYLHVVDSLLLLDAFENAPDGPFVDMGTGAGFPGIPLAIVTGRQGLLVDSVGKKAKAVSEFVDDLGISDRVQVAAARMEQVGQDRRASFSVATARAVAQTRYCLTSVWGSRSWRFLGPLAWPSITLLAHSHEDDASRSQPMSRRAVRM